MDISNNWDRFLQMEQDHCEIDALQCETDRIYHKYRSAYDIHLAEKRRLYIADEISKAIGRLSEMNGVTVTGELTVTWSERDTAGHFLPENYRLLIADEISKAVVGISEMGGDIVTGELTWLDGACRQEHWWVEFHTCTFDPVGDIFLAGGSDRGRRKRSTGRSVIDAILPDYEKWRV